MTREKLRVVALGGALAAAMLTGLSACSTAPNPTMNDPRPVPSRLYAILEAPSNLGLRRPDSGREPGVRRLPEALEAAGFSRRNRSRNSSTCSGGPSNSAIRPSLEFFTHPAKPNSVARR